MPNQYHLRAAYEAAIARAAERHWPIRFVTSGIQAQAREDWLVRNRRALECIVDETSASTLDANRKLRRELLALPRINR